MAKPMSGGKRSYRPIHLLSYSMGEYYPYESGAVGQNIETIELSWLRWHRLESEKNLSG